MDPELSVLKNRGFLWGGIGYYCFTQVLKSCGMGLWEVRTYNKTIYFKVPFLQSIPITSLRVTLTLLHSAEKQFHCQSQAGTLFCGAQRGPELN